MVKFVNLIVCLDILILTGVFAIMGILHCGYLFFPFLNSSIEVQFTYTIELTHKYTAQWSE